MKVISCDQRRPLKNLMENVWKWNYVKYQNSNSLAQVKMKVDISKLFPLFHFSNASPPHVYSFCLFLQNAFNAIDESTQSVPQPQGKVSLLIIFYSFLSLIFKALELLNASPTQVFSFRLFLLQNASIMQLLRVKVKLPWFHSMKFSTESNGVIIPYWISLISSKSLYFGQ